MQRLFKSYSLFSQRRLDVRQHLLAQQNESLPGAVCRDTRAVDIGPPEEALADGACGGVGITEEVGAGLIQPLFQRGGVKAGAGGSGIFSLGRVAISGSTVNAAGGSSSSNGGSGSAAPSAPASPLPGLTVTDKSGAVIDSISTQSGNTLTVCVGRLTASFRISLAALRQLRAEGIETITFQTILCSTTLSVDELLAMGGEDAEIVLTHHIRSSTLTVSGRAM